MDRNNPFQLNGNVVAVLQRPEKELNQKARMIGFVAALLLSGGLTFLVSRGVASVAMFDLRTVTGYFPLTIIWFAIWSVIWASLRTRRVKALQQASRPNLAENCAQFLRQQTARGAGTLGVRTLCEAIESTQYNVSPVLARIRSVLHQWSLERGLAPVDVVLQNHLCHEQEKVADAYTLMRLFVWAMPVLGLIGTVFGISRAVGGFASFLSGGVNDIEKIKFSLVGVTQGLSFAFMVTMLGLLGALIVMLWISSLQALEERVIADAHKQVTDTFLPVLQEAVPITEPPAASLETAVSRALSVLEESGHHMARLADTASAFQQGWQQAANQITTRLAEEGRANEMRGEALRQALSEMTETAGEMVRTQKALAETVSRLEREGELPRALAGVEEALSQLQPFLKRLSGPILFTLTPATDDEVSPRVVRGDGMLRR